jgi:30S ribosome assembly GTPase
MSTIARCKGCGIELQYIDETAPGYANDRERVYCKACYRLLHYGEGGIHLHPEDLPKLKANGLVLMVASVLHLDLLFSYPIYRYQPDARFVYIINQVDLLPDSTNLDLFLHNLVAQAKRRHIPFEQIILMSAKNPQDLENLRLYLAKQPEKDIHLIGVQNSGKTTIFKALTDDDQALALKKAGLTQRVLTGQMNDHVIYDMPGLYQSGYLHQFMDYADYRKLIPDKTIKPRIYKLDFGQSIRIEDLFILTNLAAQRSVVFYLSEHVRVNRVNTKRISDSIDRTWSKKTFHRLKGKQQITFSDMGMMHVEGPFKISLYYVKDAHVNITEALFK